MSMSHYLEETLRNAQAPEVTELFLWVLVVIFVTSVFCCFTCKASRFTAYTPNLLTSVGILGTFAGIVIGLMAFDPSDIDNSISSLLDGLKTAFITSLAGMGSSIVFKILSTTPLLNRKQVGNGKDVGPLLIDAMQEQNQHMKALRNAIAGEEESSVAGQIKLFRNDSRDRGTEMKQILLSNNQLIDKLVDSSEALKQAIVGEEEGSITGQIKLFRADVSDRTKSLQQTLETGLQSLSELQMLAREQRSHFEKFAGDLWRQMEAFGDMLSNRLLKKPFRGLFQLGKTKCDFVFPPFSMTYGH